MIDGGTFGQKLADGTWEIDGLNYGRCGEAGEPFSELDFGAVIFRDVEGLRQPLALNFNFGIEYASPEEAIAAIAADWSQFLQGPGRTSNTTASFDDPGFSQYRQTIFTGSQNAWPVVRTRGELIYVATRASGIDTLGIYPNAASPAPLATYVAGGAIFEMVLHGSWVYLIERNGVTAHNRPHWDVSCFAARSIDTAPLKASRVTCLNAVDLSVVWQGGWMSDVLLLGAPSLAILKNFSAEDPEAAAPLAIVALGIKQIGRYLYPHQANFNPATGARTVLVKLDYGTPTPPAFATPMPSWGPTNITGDNTTIDYPHRNLSGSQFDFVSSQVVGQLSTEPLRAYTSWSGINWMGTDQNSDHPGDTNGHHNWIISQNVHIPTGPRRMLTGFDMETGAKLWEIDGSSGGGTSFSLFYPILASSDGKLLVRREDITTFGATWYRWPTESEMITLTGSSRPVDWPPGHIPVTTNGIESLRVYYEVRSIKTGALMRERRIETRTVESKYNLPDGACVGGEPGGTSTYTASIGTAYTPNSSSTNTVLAYHVPGVAISIQPIPITNPVFVPRNAYVPTREVNISKDYPLRHDATHAALSYDEQTIIFEPRRVQSNSQGGPTISNGRSWRPLYRPSGPTATFNYGTEYEVTFRNWVVAYDWNLNEKWSYAVRDLASSNSLVGAMSTNLVCTEGKVTFLYCPGQYQGVSGVIGSPGPAQYCELIHLDVETGAEILKRPYWAYSLIGPCQSPDLDYETAWATNTAIITRNTAQTGLMTLHNDPEPE